jgi:hypothetical protein
MPALPPNLCTKDPVPEVPRIENIFGTMSLVLLAAPLLVRVIDFRA